MITIIKSLYKVIKLLSFFAILLYLSVFIVNNDQYIDINLEPIPYIISAKIFVIMISFFILGIVISILTSIPRNIVKNYNQFFSQRHIKKLDKKLTKEKEKNNIINKELKQAKFELHNNSENLLSLKK